MSPDLAKNPCEAGTVEWQIYEDWCAMLRRVEAQTADIDRLSALRAESQKKLDSYAATFVRLTGKPPDDADRLSALRAENERLIAEKNAELAKLTGQSPG